MGKGDLTLRKGNPFMKIAVFQDSAGFIEPECINAFQRLDHIVKVIRLERDSSNPDVTLPYNIVERVSELLSFMPDLLFMVNGNGIDNMGLIPKIAALLKIPLALWYVDRPYTLENWNTGYVSPTTIMFLTDKLYMQDLRDSGLKKSFYLPLATNPARFSEGIVQYKDRLMDIVFVGKLDRDKAYTYFNILKDRWNNKPDNFDEIFRKIINTYRNRPGLSIALISESTFSDHGFPLRFPSTEIKTLFYNSVEYMANVLHRTETIKALKPFNITVCGGWEWLDVVDKRHYLNEVNYFSGLASIYKNAIINLNISRLQLMTALNQRLFDVPAAGGFLITDYREDVEELFDTGREIVCYRNIEELKSNIRYFQSHPEERRKIAESAKEKVMEKHTYEIRMSEMFKYVSLCLTDSEYSEQMNRLIRTDHSYVDALNLLGAAAYQIKQNGLSEEFFKLGLSLDPFNTDGKKGLEVINRILGKRRFATA